MSGIGDETFSLRGGKEEGVSVSSILDEVNEVFLTASGGVVVDDLTFFFSRTPYSATSQRTTIRWRATDIARSGRASLLRP